MLDDNEIKVSFMIQYKPIAIVFICVFTAISYFSFGQSKCSIIPTELTCEYLENPTGIDVRQPRFSWKLKATNPHDFAQKQTAYRIMISADKKQLKKDKADVWNSGWVSSNEMILVPFQGKSLQSDKDYWWKVQVRDEKGIVSSFSQINHFSTGLFDQGEWSAKWIGTDEIYDPYKGDNKIRDPWFRKVFNLNSKPQKAALYVASVGYHEVYVNGEKIDNHVLAPAVSDHTKRARYIAYDISKVLKKGENIIGLWLGVSWSIFAPYVTNDKPRTPMVIAQSDIYDPKNNLIERIITDETWKTHPSPNLLIGNWGFGAGGYGGELWNDSLQDSGWNQIVFNDNSWKQATVYKPDLRLSAQMVETNILKDEILPKKIEKQKDGSYRIDMGVNFAGWIEMKLHGNPGDTISLLFSEREHNEMTFGLHNRFVIGPSGEGIFKNRFNYNSGRWITVKGVTREPQKEDIRGWMVRTDYMPATTFECSDSLQNWIYNTVKWTFENLSLGGYVVDCPQRERFGYGGDAHATSETGLLNYRLGAFYTKWMQDWRDVQGTEPIVGNMNDSTRARRKPESGRMVGGGILPQTAPTYFGGGGPAWGGIVVSLPWFLYQYHGDKRILSENFELIKGWLSFLNSHVKNNMLQRYGGGWDFLGDWLWPGATAQGMNNNKDENLFFNNCYWIYNLNTAAKIATIIGKDEESHVWKKQAEQAASVVHKKYYHPEEHNYSDNSMRSLAAALYGNIMPSELRALVLKRLEEEILIHQKGHIDVGITGGAMLFKVLREERRDDLILAMTSQTTYPGWGFMLDNGATTIWEMWEKDLPGHSLLHSSYLYPGAWYIDGLAGIWHRDDSPGFQKINIRVPDIKPEQVSWAKTAFNSLAGNIKSGWERNNGKTILDITIPPNTSAIVYFPYEAGKVVKVSSALAKNIGEEKGYIMYQVPAGKYRFKN